MANTNKAFGLRPFGKLGSNVNNDGNTQYNIASGTATAIFQGDTVTFSAAGGSAGSTGFIVKQTPGDANILGVFIGCQYVDPTSGKTTFKNYYPGGITSSFPIQAFIVDDPQALFLIQASGVAGVTAVGRNADLVQTVAGNTTSGVSGLELSTGTLASTAALNVKVVGISTEASNNNPTAAYCDLIVVINEHLYRGPTAGVV
jgi:hypothetical protein